MRPGVILGLVAALYCAAPAGLDAAPTGDFNQDQRLDQQDLDLLRAALGSADPAYDLSGDGWVDLEDFFRWADQRGAAGPADSTAAADSLTAPLPELPAETTPAPAPADTVAALADTARVAGVPADTVSAGPDSSQVVAMPADTVQVTAPADTVAADTSQDGLPAADATASPPPSGPAAAPPLVAVPMPANMDPLRLGLVLPGPSLPGPADSAGAAPLPPALPPFQPAPAGYIAVTTTKQTTTVWLTSYTIAIRNSNPFGISSLRLSGQPVDFVHPALPLGDWEWFWFSDPTLGQAKIKLLEEAWQAPEVARSDTGVVLRFRRQDVLRRGVEVEVAYYLDARRPEFTAEYTVHNHSGQFLVRPYMMVGFPGFANQQWVEEVATAEKARRPQRPFADFRAEAKARQLTDYLLLRQDWDPEHQPPEVLQGAVVLRAAGHTYSLHTRLVGTSGLRGGYIAHTNKPRYLTSHLYAFFANMGQGQSQRLAVRYALSRGD